MFLVFVRVAAADNTDRQARSAIVGFDNAPNTLTVYFSLACPHCLRSIETVHRRVHDMITASELKIELIEVPGMVGKPPAAAYETKEQKRRAIRNGYQASLVFSCAAGMEPNMAWRRIARFYYALRKAVDPEKFDYRNWAFAEPGHLTMEALKPWPDPGATSSGKMIAAYYHSRLQVGWPPHLEMQRCVSDRAQVDPGFPR
jgi:hypothetical protein